MSGLLLPRRGFLTGALALIAAPAIVRASSLMGIKALPAQYIGWDLASGPDKTSIMLGDIITISGPSYPGPVEKKWIVTEIIEGQISIQDLEGKIRAQIS